MQRGRRRAHPELRAALHRQLPGLPQLLPVGHRLGIRIGGFARPRRDHLADAVVDRHAASRRDADRDRDAADADAGNAEGQRGPDGADAIAVGLTS